MTEEPLPPRNTASPLEWLTTILTLFIWPLVHSGRCSFRLTPCSTPENTDKRLTVNTLLVCFKLSLFFWSSVQDVTALSSYLSLVEKDVGRFLPLPTHRHAGCFIDRCIVEGEPAVSWRVRTLIRMDAVTDVVS